MVGNRSILDVMSEPDKSLPQYKNDGADIKVGDMIGRIKKERINVPLLRKAAPGRSDEEIMAEAGKLDDYDYDSLEEGIVFEDYGKRAKGVAGKSMEERMQFRNDFMSEYGTIFNRMQNRLAGEM